MSIPQEVLCTVDFNPGTGVKDFCWENQTFIIQKMDADGNFIWAKSFGGNDFDQSYSIAIDAIKVISLPQVLFENPLILTREQV
jgi:hypothetical protein